MNAKQKMCFNFVTGRLLLNFFCNLFECKSSLHFHQSFTNLTAQTSRKHGLQWFRNHVLCLQQQWKHCLTLWDSYIWQQIPRTRSTKRVLVKRRKQRVEGGTVLASVCLCLSAPLRSHWSMQTFCPYAQQTLQKQPTSVPVWQHDHSYFCQEWIETLMVPTSQTKIKCYIVTSQEGVNADYKHMALEARCSHPNALKDARINITFSPVGCVNRILTQF